MEWFHNITEGRGAHLSFPPCLTCFLDPHHALQKDKVRSDKLHPNNAKKDLSLSTVYELVTGARLVNAHDSLVDAKAQTVVARDIQRLQCSHLQMLLANT